MSLLEVSDLSVDFLREGQFHEVVHSVSFNLNPGETLGIAGESGSGKSVTCMSLMGLLPSKQSRSRGSALLSLDDGSTVNLLSLDEKSLRQFRGTSLAMVFQEPMTSLNPVQRCGEQVVEMLLEHEQLSKKEARAKVIDLFNEVRLPRPEKIFDSYPHEISGGQKQRVVIAMALVCKPRILIADEPTTALDVTVQKSILQLLKDLQQKYGIAIIFITHDLGVMAQMADRLLVMYHGDVVEQGLASDILHHPQHEYTQHLMRCSKLEKVDTPSPSTSQGTSASTPLLQVRDLRVSYSLKRNIFGKVLQSLNAVDGISFDVFRGETLGLVGESGCGKSTLGRAILRLVEHQSGSIVYDGVPLDKLSASEMKRLRGKMQIVFQDPYSSLNPRITVGDAILEPLMLSATSLSKTEARQRVMDLLERVGLSADHYKRYPHEFSGGQRQRVCIARALIMQPELIICDESVSALDVSVRAQILELLNDLKSRFGYTYLFVTHDLSVVRFMADRLMVMQRGRIVEMGPTEQIYTHPQQPYTQTLLAAIPTIDKT